MVGEGIHSNEILHWRWSGKATRHPVKNQGLGFTQFCFSDVAGGGGGWQGRGQDDLIKAITWFLYLFRTCHLVTRAAVWPQLPDSDFESGQRGPRAMSTMPWPLPLVKHDSVRPLGKNPRHGQLKVQM